MKEQLIELEQEMEPVERALDSLTDQEQEFIELKFFTDEKVKSTDIMLEMDVKKTRFHEIQNQAYIKIAESLKIL